MFCKFILFMLLSSVSGAQSSTQSSTTERPWEISVTGTSFLATGIYRTHEILLGVDPRISIPTGKGKFEIDAMFANGNGENYRVVSLDYRYDLGIEWMPAFFLAGVHGDWWTPPAPYDDMRYSGGWHIGGGFMQPLFSGWSVREDFRYRLGPGTSLIVGLGLNYQFSN